MKVHSILQIKNRNKHPRSPREGDFGPVAQREEENAEKGFQDLIVQ